MKKIILIFLILMFMSVNASADTDISLLIDGTPLVTDTSPVVESGRLLVPVSHLLSAMGAQFQWDPVTRSVDINHINGTIRLVINSSVSLVNGHPVQMDVPPRIINNRTFVPLRFLSENLDARVGWDGVNRTVYVVTTGNQPDAFSLSFEGVREADLPQHLRNWININRENRGFHMITSEGYTYVMAAAGLQPSGGFSMEITGITRINNNQAFARALLTTPGPEEIVTMVLTHPFSVVRLSTEDLTSIEGDIAQQQRGVRSITLYFLRETATAFLTDGEERIFRTNDVTPENVMAVLLAGPESSTLTRIIPRNVRLLGVTQTNDLVNVNFSRELLDVNVGAEGEGVLVNTIVKTLVQLPGINRVQILVEGSIVESLAGHVLVNRPLP